MKLEQHLSQCKKNSGAGNPVVSARRVRVNKDGAATCLSADRQKGRSRKPSMAYDEPIGLNPHGSCESQA